MRPFGYRVFLALLSAILLVASAGAEDPPIRIGSKTFTESYVLGEITAQLLQNRGLSVERALGLGGTLIAWEALKSGEIDVYPEYTGTLTQAVLKQPGLTLVELRSAVAAHELNIPVLLGFNNSYAVAVATPVAQRLGLNKVSDLRAQPQLTAGFSHEFLNRGDGWQALRQTYGLPQEARGIEHALGYDALEAGQLDITDAYSTDGELAARDISLLADDLNFFPSYQAILLTRADLPTEARAIIGELDDKLSEAIMRQLNYRVAIGGESPAAVAASFLRTSGLVADATVIEATRMDRILANTATHLKLTGIALLLACVVAIPLSLVLSRYQQLSRALLYGAGLVQTIPALALLALLIPLVGLGELPAVLALFLYSLLPIVRNTLTGLFSVDPLLKEVATGMGLTDGQRLWHVELPLAVPTLLAGIKTAAIISIGTATLAAFVGAGGLGEPIITGLNLNDHRLILEGALPAAALAIIVEVMFEWLERVIVPAHLRQ
ncbi:MAG: glycine betaine ABC transporter substrate-binding protein [Pseudomonadota bacterium]